MNHSVIFLTFILVCLTQACDSNSQTGYSQTGQEQDYKKQVRDVKVIEAAAPSDFLKVEGTYRKNLVGKTIIDGRVSSSATVVTYKDVNITIGFYSRTNTLIGSESYIIYDFVEAQKSKDFEIRVKAPKATNSVSINVVSATPVY